MYKVLSVNTYGGSLLLAVKLAKMEVVASLEDVGFGSDIQALNFPHIPLYTKTADWPERFPGTKWKDIIAIAHPPCAAFSMMNRDSKNSHAQGTSAESFQCHVNVMNYALGSGVAGLAIESVPGAIAAKEIYEERAEAHGYKAFFVTQNAVSFGVPQWRQRLWVWFLKKKTLTVSMKPRYALTRDVVKFDGDLIQMPKKVEDVYPAAVKKMGVAADELRGKFFSVTRTAGLHSTENEWNAFTAANGNGTRIWRSAFPAFLDPTDFGYTVMANSEFYLHGKPLTDKDMCRIMGFPANYRWGKRAKQYRMYLSKGICPPVGAWVLQQLRANLEGPVPTQYTIKPGEILDLNPKRKDALAAARRGRE